MTDAHQTASGTSPGANPAYEAPGMHCPYCRYNLTGLRDDRCPECGKPFDRALLLAQLAGAPAPIPIWSDRARIGVVPAAARVIFLVLFASERWARMLPAQLDPQEHRRFQATCYALAIVIVLAAGALTPRDFVPLLGLVCAWCVGALICESLVTNAVFDSEALTCIGAGMPPPRRRGVGEMLCPHILLTAVGFAVVQIIAALRPNFPLKEQSHWAAVQLAALWWWLAVLRSARAIGYPAADLLGIVLLVPVLALVSAMAGGIVLLVGGFFLMVLLAGMGLG